MRFKTLLPFGVFVEAADVSRIYLETESGAMGILPRRLDCTASLSPGILIYETLQGGERFLALDSGVMVKTGLEVIVSTRRALEGTDLMELKDKVREEFLNLDEHENAIRQVMAKLEVGFVKRFAMFKNEFH